MLKTNRLYVKMDDPIKKTQALTMAISTVSSEARKKWIFEGFPHDVIVRILRYCDLRDLVSVSSIEMLQHDMRDAPWQIAVEELRRRLPAIVADNPTDSQPSFKEQAKSILDKVHERLKTVLDRSSATTLADSRPEVLTFERIKDLLEAHDTLQIWRYLAESNDISAPFEDHKNYNEIIETAGKFSDWLAGKQLMPSSPLDLTWSSRRSDSRNKKLIFFPVTFCQLTTHKVLNLATNLLTSLPERFGQLTALNRLYLSNNQLTDLPESFGQLHALVVLDLTNNKFTTFFENFGGLSALKKLKSLILTGNQLTTFPNCFIELSALKGLDLTNTQLPSLPEDIGGLTALKTLNLSKNRLTDLPENIGQLTALMTLNLQGNKLASLPESIGQLTALTVLNLDGNQLKDLPNFFRKLTALVRLYLANNQLTSLPDPLRQLTGLNILSLSNNQLTSLPDYLGQLPRLKSLALQGNCLITRDRSLELKGHQLGKQRNPDER